MSKDFGKMLNAGGKGMLDGFAQMGGLPGNNLNGKALPGSGMDLAGGPMSGVNLIEALFKKIGIFGNDKKEDELPYMNPAGNFTGPRY